MSYIFQIRNVWDVSGPSIEQTVLKLLEKKYTIGYKLKRMDIVVISVNKEHSAELIFSKYNINDLRIEIDLENYFSRAQKNIASIPKKMIESVQNLLQPKMNFLPTMDDFCPFMTIIKLYIYGTLAVGNSTLPNDLADILKECFGHMGVVEWGNWEEALKDWSVPKIF